MNVICKPRAQGKTYELIKRCAETNGLILTSNYYSKRIIMEMAEKFNFKIKEPEIFVNFVYNRNHGIDQQRLFIDNLEDCLSCTLSIHRIDTIVINKEDCEV